MDSPDTKGSQGRLYSPSIVSSSTVNRSSFDERLKTRFSVVPIEENVLKNGSSSPIKDDDNEPIKWIKLKKLWAHFTHATRIEHGAPTSMATGSQICIGTSKGFVLIFDYKQELRTILKSATTYDPITVLTLSADSTHVASGHQSGDIYLWEISKSVPILKIPAIPKEDLLKNPKANGHLHNTPIHNLYFMGKRRTALLSTDITGIMVQHNGYRNIRGLRVQTKNVLGKYHMNNNKITDSTILSFAPLALGTAMDRTDNIGVIALMTSNVLLVISTNPSLQTHFKVGKPKSMNKRLPITGSLAWFPAVKTENGKRQPKLAYCWSNVLTVLDCNNESIKDSQDQESLILKLENKKRWAGREAIISVSWLTKDIIALITESHRLLLINYDTMTVSSIIDLFTKSIHVTQLFKPTTEMDRLTPFMYHCVFKVYKHRLFILGKHDIYIGTLNNWADRLLELLSKGDYLEALTKAKDYYDGNCDLNLLRLPKDDNQRHLVVSSHILQIMTASLDFIFSKKQLQDEAFLELFLENCISCSITIDVDQSTYDQSYEAYMIHGYEYLFFNTLEPFILNNKIHTLTPSILKAMIPFYLKMNRGERVEQLVCLLDIEQLDIDATVQLCEKYKLQDLLIYVTNYLFQDYITPLVNFIKNIIQISNEAANLSVLELESLSAEARSVYGYITYILTGRHYPIERLIDFDKETQAKSSVYYVLFNGTSIEWPKGAGKLHITNDLEHEPAFPYLYLLLKYDCFSMLSALNEVFEDSQLNDEDINYSFSNDLQNWKVSRQYVVDVLLGVFNDNDFKDQENTLLAIFIARNYPKYKQFIRLSESVLHEVLTKLCIIPDPSLKKECELSLQSLLSVYHIPNLNEWISVFEECGFFNVLFNVYKYEHKYDTFLKLWLQEKQKQALQDVGDDSDESYNDIGTLVETLENCFESVGKNSQEKAGIETFLSENFEPLFSIEKPSNIVRVLNKYCPKLHYNILRSSNEELQYEYISAMVEQEKCSYGSVVYIEFRTLYVKLLCEFDQGALLEFIKKIEVSTIDAIAAESYLTKFHQIEALVLLLEKERKQREALQILIQHISTLGQQLQLENTKSDVHRIEGQLWNFLMMVIEILKIENDEELMVQVMEMPVALFNSFTEGGNDGKETTNILKRFVQDTFMNIIGIYQSTTAPENVKSTFVDVFSSFLQRASSKITTLGDVRAVLREIFIVYGFEKVILNITLGLINEDIYKVMEKLHSKKYLGWTTGVTDCVICGKKLWGSSMPNEVYSMWEEGILEDDQSAKKTSFFINDEGELMTNSTVNGAMQIEPVQLNDYSPYELVVFRCRHGYHSKCLFNLGTQKKIKCIICAADDAQ
ncbi:hypothetical protein LJB42_001780 [Komagataella kurtzmanii]|nr:hypothetical protein LJB42_001780 [Komagataella kurtzmanii]